MTITGISNHHYSAPLFGADESDNLYQKVLARIDEEASDRFTFESAGRPWDVFAYYNGSPTKLYITSEQPGGEFEYKVGLSPNGELTNFDRPDLNIVSTPAQFLSRLASDLTRFLTQQATVQ